MRVGWAMVLFFSSCELRSRSWGLGRDPLYALCCAVLCLVDPVETNLLRENLWVSASLAGRRKCVSFYGARNWG